MTQQACKGCLKIFEEAALNKFGQCPQCEGKTPEPTIVNDTPVK